jgi:imidazoleglycerol phosphate synthase glutamine amidotransferase subunit HisH
MLLHCLLAPHVAACLHDLQVESVSDIVSAEKLIFPGVGAFGSAMEILQQRGYTQVRLWHLVCGSQELLVTGIGRV